DGNDPIAVFHATKEAAARAREGGGPTLLECKTVRWERHSAMSAGKYQNEEEALKWKQADPIPRFEATLREQGVSDEELRARQERAKGLNDEALDFAIQSNDPKPETAGDFVFG